MVNGFSFDDSCVSEMYSFKQAPKGADLQLLNSVGSALKFLHFVLL